MIKPFTSWDARPFLDVSCRISVTPFAFFDRRQRRDFGVPNRWIRGIASPKK